MSRARNRADGDFGDLDITNIGAVSLDSIKGDADANTNIAFSGSDVITITTGGTTAATFNASQILTLSDDLIIKNSGTIGAANDTDLLTLGNGTLTVAGEVVGTGFTGTLDGILGSGTAAAATTTTLASTTITASGRILVDDTTEATSTTDGSLQTDGGLSVVKDAVIGDDLKLLSDGSVLSFGSSSNVSFSHVIDTGVLLNSTNVIQFRDSAISIGSPADGDLDINADDEIELNSTLVDVNANLDVSGTIVSGGTLTATTSIGIGSAILTEAEMEMLDGITAGTAAANKAVVLDGSKNIATIGTIGSGNITSSGTIQGTTITATTAFVPDASDGAALGTTSLEFSDLFLADGAVINFGADQDINITHVADTGLTTNADFTVGDDLFVSGGLIDLKTNSGSVATIKFYCESSNAHAQSLVAAPHSEGATNTLTLPGTGGNARLVSTTSTAILTNKTLTSALITTNLSPTSADGAALGSATKEFSDLFLADSSVIYFGNDQDVTLTHDPDDGLFLKSIATGDNSPVILTLQTGETDIAADDVIGQIDFQAPDEGTGTDAVLVAAGIAAVSEGDFSSSNNATKLVFKTGASEAASEKMSLSSAGLLTIADDLVIKDAGTIGSASDTDAISISSGGVVNISATTASTNATSGALTVAGGAGIAADLSVGDDIRLISDSAVLSFGADGDITVTHAADTGLTVNGTFTGTSLIAATSFLPDANAGADIGTTSLGFGDVFIADDKKIQFGNDQDATIEYDEDGTDKLSIAGAQVVFGKSVLGSAQTANATGNTTLDFATYQNFLLTATGNVTLVNPSTETVGQSGFIVIKQDGTGSRTLSIGTQYVTVGDGTYTLSTAAAAIDLIPYVVQADGVILLGNPSLAFA